MKKQSIHRSFFGSLLAVALLSGTGTAVASDDTIYYLSTQLVLNRVDASADGGEVVADVFDGSKVGSVYLNATTGDYSWAFPGEAGNGYVAPTTEQMTMEAVYLPGTSGPADGGGGETGPIQIQSWNGRRSGQNSDGPHAQLIWYAPILIGAGMCYANSNITVSRAHSHCSGFGKTVKMRSTGVCGMGASYSCMAR